MVEKGVTEGYQHLRNQPLRLCESSCITYVCAFSSRPSTALIRFLKEATTQNS